LDHVSNKFRWHLNLGWQLPDFVTVKMTVIYRKKW